MCVCGTPHCHIKYSTITKDIVADDGNNKARRVIQKTHACGRRIIGGWMVDFATFNNDYVYWNRLEYGLGCVAVAVPPSWLSLEIFTTPAKHHKIHTNIYCCWMLNGGNEMNHNRSGPWAFWLTFCVRWQGLAHCVACGYSETSEFRPNIHTTKTPEK